MFRFSQKVTRSSRSLSDVPPVEQSIGLRVFAIFSISSQSLTSELASLISGNPSSMQKSTDFSSNGVAIGMQPAFLIASVSAMKLSRDMAVSIVFLM